MSFQIRTTRLFLDQVKKLGKESRKLIGSKIDLVKENPYRFKRIHSKRFLRAFRVRLSLEGKETRLIYAVIKPNIIIACLLERKNDYRDLEKMLAIALRN
ncbi:hypothetical protein KJ765_04900 [Candidatus Micrarchaeota archaeon]|nr:hypothetical protein [Candidatus Micrarchaeota archaeon]